MPKPTEFFKGKTKLPEELIKPITQLREDLGLPFLPDIEVKVAKVLSKLPPLPFEEKIKLMLQGKFEEALPKMMWESEEKK